MLVVLVAIELMTIKLHIAFVIIISYYYDVFGNWRIFFRVA